VDPAPARRVGPLAVGGPATWLAPERPKGRRY
jgi:hypothetical protein